LSSSIFLKDAFAPFSVYMWGSQPITTNHVTGIGLTAHIIVDRAASRLWGSWWRRRSAYFHRRWRTAMKPQPITPKDKNAHRYEGEHQDHSGQ
jgi:hypothetical protein